MPSSPEPAEQAFVRLAAVRGDLAGLLAATDGSLHRAEAARRELGRLGAMPSAAALARPALPLDRFVTCLALATLFYFA